MKVENIESLIVYLKEIKEQGTTLVLVEHRIKELLPLTDRVIGLKLGQQNEQELNTIESIKTFLI